MLFISWVKNPKLPRHKATRPAPRRPAARLRLECLEDRAVPATFTVNTTLDEVTPGGKLSLREAITLANANPGADTIVLPAGVFKITLAGAGEDANLTGDFDIKDSLTIRGAGAGLTVVDGQQLDRVFDVRGTAPSSIKVVLQGLTVRNGSVTGDSGGGIQVADADLVVRNCAITGNREAEAGGGISNVAAPGTGIVTVVGTTVGRNVAGGSGGGLAVFGTGSVLTVSGSTVRRNVSGAGGGGIGASSVAVTNSTVSGNSAPAGAGGGINAATATVTNSAVSGNAAVSGGGVVATTATVTNSAVSGNAASNAGGGIGATETATVTNSTVSGNTASVDGGGIEAGAATVTNTTVSGNTTKGTGGGISATTATLVNCTIAENVAHTGGGLFHTGVGTFSVKNTIVALNLTDFFGADPDVSGAFTSQGHNLIGDGTGSTGFTNGTSGDIVGTAADPIDPRLGVLRNNGGPTQTMALLAGSPAIDHGDNNAVDPVTGKPLTTDQRGPGFPRRKDGNGDGRAVIDIGAFER